MSHTSTCERDVHVDPPPSPIPVSAEHRPTERPLDRFSDRHRDRHRAGLLVVAEVRWAGLATVAFLGALAVRALGGPVALAWALFATCYLSGGWQPGLSGLSGLRKKIGTSIS